MEIISLICTNEEKRIVTIEHFKTYEDAKSKMAIEYERERRDALDCGFEETLCNIINAYSAYVEYGGVMYEWTIVKGELK